MCMVKVRDYIRLRGKGLEVVLESYMMVVGEE